MAGTYTAKDITVLEGLEPVRKRPGMYIGGVGSPGLHHLVWEILDNSIDEAMNGYASDIRVTLHADGASITIEDDGRGAPIDTTAELLGRAKTRRPRAPRAAAPGGTRKGTRASAAGPRKTAGRRAPRSKKSDADANDNVGNS